MKRLRITTFTPGTLSKKTPVIRSPDYRNNALMRLRKTLFKRKKENENTYIYDKPLQYRKFILFTPFFFVLFFTFIHFSLPSNVEIGTVKFPSFTDPAEWSGKPWWKSNKSLNRWVTLPRTIRDAAPVPAEFQPQIYPGVNSRTSAPRATKNQLLLFKFSKKFRFVPTIRRREREAIKYLKHVGYIEVGLVAFLRERRDLFE